MSDLNCCTFTGNLTKDAEMKLIGAKQTPCCEFTLANNTGFGQYAKATFINVQLWGAKGESLTPYLKKGNKVGVSGELVLNEWVDQNGVKKSNLRLTATSITLLGSPRGQSAADTEDY
jgi:single-strand DNA-binding protein